MGSTLEWGGSGSAYEKNAWEQLALPRRRLLQETCLLSAAV